MSIGHKPLMREWDLAACSNRESDLKDVFLSTGTIFEIASRVTHLESFSFVVLFVLTLVLWLISRKQTNETRQTEEDREEKTDGRQLTAKIPPGSSGWPLIGETIEFVLDGRKFFRSRRAKHGSVFRSHLCGLPTVVIVGAENVQKVLTASESSLIQSPPSSFLKLFGRGALSSTVGRHHSHLQRSVMRLFTPRHLSRFVTPVQRVIRGHVARWRDAPDVVNGSDACREMSLSVVYQCLFGFHLDRSEATRITDLFQTFSDGVFAFPVNLPGFAFHRAMVARDGLRRLVTERNNSSNSSASSSSFTNDDNESQLSMLDLLHSMNLGDSADGKSEVTDVDVPDLILELLFGANESTASAMCTTLVELSENQSVLDKIRCELRQLGVTPGDLVDYETLRHMTYTSDVVKEVLRVQPPIAGAFRKTCKPFQIQDYVIPAGWVILYGITDTHESSSAFDEVHRFNPDRWKNIRLGRATTTESDRERSFQREHREGHGGSNQTAAKQTREEIEKREEKQTREETEKRKEKQTREETEKRKEKQTREETEKREEKQTREETEKREEKQTREETEKREGKQTMAQTKEGDETTTVRSISRFDYLPFGAGGKRFCVGEALARMVLSLFLVEIADGTNGWRLMKGRPEIKTAPIPFPKDRLPILFNGASSSHGLRSNGAA